MGDLWGKKIIQMFFATPQQRDDRLNMRAWFALFCSFLAAIALLSQWGFQHYSLNCADWARTLWLLGLYIFYFAIACTYVPLPTAWFVLFLASPTDGLIILPAGWRILAVAGLGAFGSAVSHLNEYHVIAYLLRLGKIGKLRQTKAYLWAHRHFQVWPFMIQVIFNIVPIPADPSRWLASMAGFPIPKFFLAQWLGRFIRYGILAVASVYLSLTLREIALIQVGLFAIAFGTFITHQFRQKRQKPVEAEMVKVTIK
jgi:membrane protein YqaA with SNARE-associated domain